MEDEEEPEDEPEEGDEYATCIYVTICDGVVKSLISNKDNMCVEVIDKDLEDIDEEIKESNKKIEEEILSLDGVQELYEYFPSEEGEK